MPPPHTRQPCHLFGGAREGYDLALLMDPMYSPESQNITSFTPFIGADGEMHDPNYRHFKLPPPIVVEQPRKGSLTESYEERLEAETRSWPNGDTASSPLRPFTQTQKREQTYTPTYYSTHTSSRPSTGSSTSSTSSAGRRLGRLIRVSYRTDHSSDEEESVFDPSTLVPSPHYAFPAVCPNMDDDPDAREHSCWSDEFDDDERERRARSLARSPGESLRQKVLAAQLGLQFTMIRTERRVKKMWGKTRKNQKPSC
ncbi:hypothetical protein BD626DRAFT_510737 [Schizophyllum amplum]|uniref:Uncharacterized protein n=1 Tax=Schizophyllum amplum TaxID=97359 RepID=A0A550C198_9AGAR|nr:hypothetical protein BD626DRAFT_510737 [Auriculariopsis ampla]